MIDIFISYAREDKVRAQILAEALERHNFSVWWDMKIPPGKTWDVYIGGALDSAGCVIVLWSEVSVKSNWVKEEADRAVRRKVLIPVLIDKIQPPLGFGRIQTVDLINWQGESSNPDFLKLINAVSNTIGRPFNTGKDTAIVSSSKKERPISDLIKEPSKVEQLGTELLNEKVSRPRNWIIKWRYHILIGLSLLIVGTVVLIILFTNSPKIRDASLDKFDEARQIREAPPDKFDEARQIRDASSYEFDGFRLGSLFAREVKSRPPYENPCDDRPLDRESRRVMIYSARECPGRPFPEHTTVIFFLPYKAGISGENQPILAFAWIGGNYFASRSNFKLHIGDPVERANDELRAPRRKFALPGGLEVQEHPGRVYSIIHNDKLVGFVVGEMPENPENDQWLHLFPHLYFDERTIDRRNEGVLE